MLTGIFSTLLLTETKGRSLEEISNENQDGFLKGKSCTSNVDVISKFNVRVRSQALQVKSKSAMVS